MVRTDRRLQVSVERQDASAHVLGGGLVVRYPGDGDR
jgi:hypothetical protein